MRKPQTTLFALCFLMTFVCISVPAQNLFGNPSCEEWGKLSYSSKSNWTNAFLAPLSLTYQGIYKLNSNPFVSNPKSAELASTSIDGFCQLHPEQAAANGAMVYLKNLMGFRDEFMPV
jgi:hypothetical protein